MIMNNILKKKKYKQWIAAYCFLFPAMILWLVWFCIPAIKSFAYSFFDYNYSSVADSSFVGFKNYMNLISDEIFFKSVQHSFEVVIIAVPVQTTLALLLALLVEKKKRGSGFFRTIFYMPYVLSTVAVATVFIYLFSERGFITKILSGLGLPDCSWATNVGLALPLIIIMFIWQQVGFFMLMFLSGLQNIPEDVLESARVDGANGWQILLKIKIPLLEPTMFLVITYGIINSFLIFDQIATVAGSGTIGSPGNALYTLVTFYYVNAYRYGDVGYGSAVAVVLFLIIFTVTILQSKFTDKKYEL